MLIIFVILPHRPPVDLVVCLETLIVRNES